MSIVTDKGDTAARTTRVNIQQTILATIIISLGVYSISKLL